ncbi:MAG: helix-turn-helix domain-containing protein [Oscillospiraceae bacterium]|jgi:transcriptional regulator with XRE-family HTH domain|nr:helix-turn-helix domain-containing protein [Oscillospiraceae bacterium]
MCYFGEKFKELRKKSGMTQEQAAEIFGVTPQSVSRWETGTNYPDVEMMPHIAIFFKTTVDELLGTERIKGEENAAKYKRDARFAMNSGRATEAIEIATAGTEAYPANYDLQMVLFTALKNDGADKHKDEITKICRRTIDYCPDQNTVLHAKYELIRLLSGWGQKDEAKQIVLTMPDAIWFTQDACWRYALEGEAWSKNQYWQIIRSKNLLCEYLGEYACEESADISHRIKRFIAQMQVQAVISELCSDVEHIVNALDNVYLAELYCIANDTEKAVVCIETATAEAMYHIDAMDKPADNGDNYYPWPTNRNLCWILWEDHLSKPAFTPLAGNERFVACIKKLKEKSKNIK